MNVNANSNPSESGNRPATRRAFIKTTSAAAVGGAMAPHLLIRPKAFAANEDSLRVALIGCGGRGTGAANQALTGDSNAVLVAMADVFEDRLQSSLSSLKSAHSDRVQVDEDHQFIGFDAYQKVMDSDVDVVLLTTPPGFRPYHLKAAIAAGKHVFCEKPMAVDGPGVRMVMEVAQQAREKKLALVAGFCWRYHYAVRAVMDRIHNGEIGDVLALQNYYNTGPLWVKPRRPEWNDMQYQMRNWYYFAWLGGDHIVEQAVHSLDKMAWAMQDEPPLRAVAHGGRQVRTGEDYGHIFDHFSVVYEYANGKRGFHACRQQAGCASGVEDHIMGTKGIAHINGGRTEIYDGDRRRWRYDGDAPNMYQVEHNELFESIRRGQPINDGQWMAQSTLIALMGRMAAYTGQSVTWEQALNSKMNLAKWVLDQEDRNGDPVFSWEISPRTPAVAMPGQTPFV